MRLRRRKSWDDASECTMNLMIIRVRQNETRTFSALKVDVYGMKGGNAIDQVSTIMLE